MPIYEYLCDNCQYDLEEMQKFDDPPLQTCPQCGEAELKRKLSVGAFHLKGSGWYKDGYKGQSNQSPKSNKSDTPSSSTSSSPSTSEKSTAA